MVDLWPPGMTRTGVVRVPWPPLSLRPTPAHSGPPRTTAQRSGCRCRSTRSLSGSTVISRAQADKWGPLHCVHTDKIEINTLSPLSTLPYLTLPSSPSSPLPPLSLHPLSTLPYLTSPGYWSFYGHDGWSGVDYSHGAAQRQKDTNQVRTRERGGGKEEGVRGEGRCTWKKEEGSFSLHR